MMPVLKMLAHMNAVCHILKVVGKIQRDGGNSASKNEIRNGLSLCCVCHVSEKQVNNA